MNWAERRERRGLLTILAVVTAVGVLGATLAYGLVTRTATAPVPGKSKRSVTARCPKGSSVALGGFHNVIGPNDDPQAMVIALTRPTKRTWKDSAAQVSDSTSNATAIAYCGHVPNLTESSNSKTLLPAGPQTKPTEVTAKCPLGERVALGGFKAELDPNFALTSPAIWVSQMRRTTQRGWRVAGLNLGDHFGKLTAIAYCGDVPKTTERSKAVGVPHGGVTRGPTATCPRGDRVAFGGFKSTITESDAFVELKRLERTTGRKWKAQAVNTNSADDGHLTSFAYCR